MHIPTHQIHNLLNAYTRRLKEKNGQRDFINSDGPEKSEKEINYSTDEKRQSIIDKIAMDIFDRISRSKIRHKTDITHKSLSAENSLLENPSPPPFQEENKFTYNMITKDGEKVSTSVEMQNSDFLIKQMGPVAQNTSKK